ncbi:MAG: polysaccharide biosynthesis C-terminal domain-containing protein, partial [Candidatus Dormibacteraeota bacterium]|nr:polysaccharide biosynthesis C-terminal domain-containing protein [Candidatus Dormibacteraeota bacterium]
VPILTIFTSYVAVGIYGDAYKYLEAVVFVPQTLMDPIFPALSQLAQGGADRLAGAATKVYKMLAVVGLPVALGMLVFAAPVIRYTIPGYEKAIPVLQVLAFGVFFLFVNNVFLYTLNAMGHQGDSTRLAVISLVVNLALNLLLIPSKNPYVGGYIGAAWATGLTELGLFIGGWIYLRKHLFAMPLVAPLRGVILAGVLCGVLMFGTVQLLGAHILTYGVAALAGAAGYLGGLRVTHAFTDDEIALAREGLRSRTKR